jgi:hypothetical protein
VVLDPDVAKLFPDADSVNKALRPIASAPPRPGRKKESSASD